MPKSKGLPSWVSSKKIISKSARHSSHQSPLTVLDVKDPILFDLNVKKRPIIWSFGLPTKAIVDVRRRYSRKLATSLGFKFINLDEQIFKWIEEYKEDIKIKNFKETYKHIIISEKFSSQRVRTEVTSRTDLVVFKLMNENIALRIVPTRSKPSDATDKNIICNNGNTLKINGKHQHVEFQPFHIVEQLSRKKVLDLLKFSMYDNLPACGFIIDGFPKDKIDLNLFEQMFYKASGAIYWVHTVHSDSSMREEEIAEYSARDYVRKMAQYTEDLSNGNQVESQLSHNSHKDSKAKVPDLDTQKTNETRNSCSNPTKKSKVNTSVEQRQVQSTEWEIRQKQSSIPSRISKSFKKVTIADTNEEFNSENATKGIEFNGQSYKDLKGSCVFTLRKKRIQKSKQMQMSQKSKQLPNEFPKYAMRNGQYTHEENERIICRYGHKAIKLEEADFLKHSPKVADILISTLKDLLTGILHKTNRKSRKYEKSLASFSTHSINFSVAEFRYKPFYPGPNAEMPTNILSKVQRVVHPLLVHHERITEPAIISVKLFIDAVFNESQDTFLRKNVAKSDNTSYIPVVTQKSKIENRISGSKINIRGRRHLSKERKLTDNNSMSFDINLVEVESKSRNPIGTISLERRKTRVLKNKSVLELEMGIDESDVFLFKSATSIKLENCSKSSVSRSPSCTSKSSKEKLPPKTVEKPVKMKSSKNCKKRRNKSRAMTILPEEIKKQENTLERADSINNNLTANPLTEKDVKDCDLNSSLIPDSVFCPTRYERNNNIIVEVAVENPVDENTLPDPEIEENDDDYLFEDLDTFSKESIVEESHSLGSFNANKDIPAFIPRKKVRDDSAQIDDSNRQYETFHIWATPYFDSENHKSFNSNKKRRRSRFWNVSDFEKYAQQEPLRSMYRNELDDESFSNQSYTEDWKTNWVATVDHRRNVSFLKRLCDFLCLCLKIYNKDDD